MSLSSLSVFSLALPAHSPFCSWKELVGSHLYLYKTSPGCRECFAKGRGTADANLCSRLQTSSMLPGLLEWTYTAEQEDYSCSCMKHCKEESLSDMKSKLPETYLQLLGMTILSWYSSCRSPLLGSAPWAILILWLSLRYLRKVCWYFSVS